MFFHSLSFITCNVCPLDYKSCELIFVNLAGTKISCVSSETKTAYRNHKNKNVDKEVQCNECHVMILAGMVVICVFAFMLYQTILALPYYILMGMVS